MELHYKALMGLFEELKGCQTYVRRGNLLVEGSMEGYTEIGDVTTYGVEILADTQFNSQYPVKEILNQLVDRVKKHKDINIHDFSDVIDMDEFSFPKIRLATISIYGTVSWSVKTRDGKIQYIELFDKDGNKTTVHITEYPEKEE